MLPWHGSPGSLAVGEGWLLPSPMGAHGAGAASSLAELLSPSRSSERVSGSSACIRGDE